MIAAIFVGGKENNSLFVFIINSIFDFFFNRTLIRCERRCRLEVKNFKKKKKTRYYVPNSLHKSFIKNNQWKFRSSLSEHWIRKILWHTIYPTANGISICDYIELLFRVRNRINVDSFFAKIIIVTTAGSLQQPNTNRLFYVVRRDEIGTFIVWARS